MTMITMMIKHVWWCPNSSLSEPIRVLQKTEKRKKNKVEGAQSSFTWSRLFRLQNLIYPLRKSRTFTTTNQNKNSQPIRSRVGPCKIRCAWLVISCVQIRIKIDVWIDNKAFVTSLNNPAFSFVSRTLFKWNRQEIQISDFSHERASLDSLLARW